MHNQHMAMQEKGMPHACTRAPQQTSLASSQGPHATTVHSATQQLLHSVA